MAIVGVRELRDRLSQYLRTVADGERIVVTQRGRPIALLVLTQPLEEEGTLQSLVKEGRAHWAGGKPRGARHPISLQERSVADGVLEERR